jgi:catechol 2,3-dioxygenase-like lactoylglutathione lyase family enzyme
MDIPLTNDFVQSIFGAAPGTTAHNRFIVFGDAAIEMYEFRPSKSIPPTDQTAVGLTHFCLMVDDVPAAVARVEAAGGRSRFPIRPFGNGRHFVYVEDPDGHVIELLDASLEECIEWVGQGTLPDHTSQAV